MSLEASDEPDYMSDDILNTCVKNDIRPGLLHNRTSQRSHEIEKRKMVTDAENKQKNPKKMALEIERREEGLKETISADNKGFAMLQKMGYKPGTAIGKKGTGIVEPVSVVVKTGRQGLGREAALKEVAIQRRAIRARHLQRQTQVMDAHTYRLRLSKQANEKQTLADLRRSQRVCEQLDQEQNISEPDMAWFWPERVKPAKEVVQEEDKEEEERKGPPVLHRPVPDNDSDSDPESLPPQLEDQEEEFEPSEQLEILTVYLRRSYLYCVWCGTKFDDEADLRDNCPGTTRDDH